MPDRITNTVADASGVALTRPSPVSAFQGDMASVELWWPQWRQYMFHTEVSLSGKNGKVRRVRNMCALLEPISRAKYPDLTEEEERISLPLQILCLAIFDAVLVHILHSISPGTWQNVKQALNNALYKNRAAACLSILERSYSTSDLIFLQVCDGAIFFFGAAS
jgi:hypothetical protein